MWFISHYLRSAKSLLEVQMSNYVLFENVKYRSQNNLWLQLVYYTSTSHTDYIFQILDSEHDKWLSSLEGERYVVTNTRS